MSFAHRHIQTAGKIVALYDGSVPLHHYLKQFFGADKKYGSKDRKAITHACYCYYRLGNALFNLSIEEKIKAGIFICTDEAGSWRTVFDENWLEHWSKDIEERIEFVQLQTELIFPFADELSNEIDPQQFSLSHLMQPDLYIRLRPGKEKKVLEQLMNAGIPFNRIGTDSIAFSNSTKIDEVVQINKDVVVQDLSSQKVGDLLSIINLPSAIIKVWDCCAASGGKSILAVDTLNNIDLTVSDVRPTIIKNLKKRFEESGIRNYHSFIADLTANHRSKNKYDLIICDAPCSGSGTWSRTPEQLSYFRKEKIDHYISLQKKIVLNSIRALDKNAYFLYITCSVFKKENEEVLDFIKDNSSLQLVRMEYLKGYDKKADSMFAALFIASQP